MSNSSDIKTNLKNNFNRLFKTTNLASVKLTITLLATLTLLILIGAWCPQKSQVGMEKVVEQFGESLAINLDKFGITDIFHSNLFLTVIALLTVNMVACSIQRVFAKIKLYQKPLLFFNSQQITKMPFHETVELDNGNTLSIINTIKTKLTKSGYTVNEKNSQLTGHKYKFSKYAATVTHIGLLSLLLGVTITSWTGFSGLEPVGVGKYLDFSNADHTNYWFGHLPDFKVKLNSTSKESYPTGQVKQWYSNLSVIGKNGACLFNKTISVNEPLSYNGVDVYQSNWGLSSCKISFNEHSRILNLRPMGNIWAAFIPLTSDTILILSFKNEKEPVKLFAKQRDWPQPRLISQIPLHKSINLGSVKVTYDDIYPVSGLQYKCDPGLPIVYMAFAFIIAGVCMATLAYSEIYVCVESSSLDKKILTIGGICPKSPSQFKILLNKLCNSLPDTGNLSQNSSVRNEFLTGLPK